MRTPWGQSQHVTELAPGIKSVSTASHGGIHLDRFRNAQVPGYMRSDGWYEEDCDWAIVAVVFPGLFEKHLESAKDTLKNWYPDFYERFYVVTLKEGESMKRDEERFLERNKNNYLVLSCNAIDGDMIEVFAGRGGRLANGMYPSDTAWFLMPRADYVNPSTLVIDEMKYQRINKGV